MRFGRERSCCAPGARTDGVCRSSKRAVATRGKRISRGRRRGGLPSELAKAAGGPCATTNSNDPAEPRVLRISRQSRPVSHLSDRATIPQGERKSMPVGDLAPRRRGRDTPEPAAAGGFCIFVVIGGVPHCSDFIPRFCTVGGRHGAADCSVRQRRRAQNVVDSDIAAAATDDAKSRRPARAGGAYFGEVKFSKNNCYLDGELWRQVSLLKLRPRQTQFVMYA